MPSLLTPLQNAFLRAFFAQPFASGFFLSGGTALSEYYLHHRYSDDLDLYTLSEESFQVAATALPSLAASLGGTLGEQVSTPMYRQAFVQVVGQPELRIDIIRDVGPQFGEHQLAGDIVIDSLLNITVNKVTALFGRAAAKDFVDLYFLLKHSMVLEELVRLAKQKDPGFSEFYFAGMLREIQRVHTLPRMVRPVTIEELRGFFEPLAEQVLLKIKPSE